MSYHTKRLCSWYSSFYKPRSTIASKLCARRICTSFLSRSSRQKAYVALDRQLAAHTPSVGPTQVQAWFPNHAKLVLGFSGCAIDCRAVTAWHAPLLRLGLPARLRKPLLCSPKLRNSCLHSSRSAAVTATLPSIILFRARRGHAGRPSSAQPGVVRGADRPILVKTTIPSLAPKLPLQLLKMTPVSNLVQVNDRLQPQVKWKILVIWLTKAVKPSLEQASSGMLEEQPGRTGKTGILTGRVSQVTWDRQICSGKTIRAGAWAAKHLGMNICGQ